MASKTITPGSIRVGFVAPCLEEGGGENWQLDLIDAVTANPPARGVRWQGVVVLDTPGNASPSMLSATQAKLPVAFGEDALYSMATLVDVLISWAVYPFPAMRSIMSTMPKLVCVAHRAESWGSLATADLAVADAIVACSTLAAASVPSTFSSKTSTILNGIDATRLTASVSRASKRSNWGVPSGNTVVGFLGRLEPERDPLAMSRLGNALPSGYSAVVVGEGSLASAVASAALAGGGAGNVILTGADADAGSCLGAFDWLVSPPLAESFGYSVAEAWYVGVPVIATAHGLASLQPSFVRTVADSAAGPALATALLADVNDPNGTASRVASARSWANANLSTSNFGTAWSNLLNTVMGGGVGGAN